MNNNNLNESLPGESALEQCSKCDFEGTKSQLKKHTRRIHQDSVATILPDGTPVEAQRIQGDFHCPLKCGKSFKDPSGWFQHLDGHCRFAETPPKKQFKATAHRTPRIDRCVHMSRQVTALSRTNNIPFVPAAQSGFDKAGSGNNSLGRGHHTNDQKRQMHLNDTYNEVASPTHVLTQYVHRDESAVDNQLNDDCLFPEDKSRRTTRSLTPIQLEAAEMVNRDQLHLNNPRKNGFDHLRQSQASTEQVVLQTNTSVLPEMGLHLPLKRNVFSQNQNPKPRAWSKRPLDVQTNGTEMDQVYEQFLMENVHRPHVSVEQDSILLQPFRSDLLPGAAVSMQEGLVAHFDSEEEMRVAPDPHFELPPVLDNNIMSHGGDLNAEVIETNQQSGATLPLTYGSNNNICLQEHSHRLFPSSRLQSNQEVPNNCRCESLFLFFLVLWRLIHRQLSSFLCAQNQHPIFSLNDTIAYLCVHLRVVFKSSTSLESPIT